MRTHVRTAAIALALAAIAGPASAQTVITEPVETRPVIAQHPLALTPAQRTTVYRTIVPRGGNRAPIVHEKVVTETVGRPPAVATERVVRPAPTVRYPHPIRLAARDARADRVAAASGDWLVDPKEWLTDETKTAAPTTPTPSTEP